MIDFRKYTNSPVEHFNAVSFRDDHLLRQRYESNFTEGTFQAVCLSSFGSEENTGATSGSSDVNSDGVFIEIVVKPISQQEYLDVVSGDFIRTDSTLPIMGDSLPPLVGLTDPMEINTTLQLYYGIQSLRAKCENKNSINVQFGEIVECYYEFGSIIEGTAQKLRFRKIPTLEDIHPKYKALLGIAPFLSAYQAFSYGAPSTLGDFASIGGDIYTRAQRLRAAGAEIRGKGTPSKKPGDEQLAKQIGIPVNVLRSFRLIESGRYGASALRFEPHLWHRTLGSDPPSGFTRNSEVVYSKVKTETNKAAFVAAYNVNKKVAVESTSFGLYQVLGIQGIRAYGSPSSFWSGFQSNPLEASNKMVIEWFSRSPRARKAANNLDFTKLAEAYNGKQQAKHYYDALLAEAYKTAEEKYG